MNSNQDQAGTTAACLLRDGADLSNVEVVALQPQPADYREALAIANIEAQRRLGISMLLSWYDKDRDVESPHTPANAMRTARFRDMWTTRSHAVPH